MANQPSSRPSFSFRQRWSIFFSVLISIAAVSSLVVMLNYLGARYYLRFPWSAKTHAALSSRTINVLNSVTNEIKVVVYYDKKDRLYDYVKDLLEEYSKVNGKISVRTVDYLRDYSDAQKIKDTYAGIMDPSVDTNLVIFSSVNGTNIVSGEKLGQYVYEPVANEKEREFREKLSSFAGEMYFTAAIFHLISAHSVPAYFLEGISSVHHLNGQGLHDYQKFRDLLRINNIEATNIATLRETNGVPADCKLLIIAGPGILTHAEIDNVRRYLEQGGRLLVLFNYHSLDYNTGLESLLAEWGVAVGRNTVKDLKNHFDESGNDVVVNSFNKTHPVVNHLQGFSLQLILPRSVGTNSTNQGSDASGAQELAWTGTSAVINDSPVTTGKRVPLMVAVEKGEVKGITDQGTTRIVVVGDSFFLDNEAIVAGRNYSFAGYAVNWLLGQVQLLQGIGPQNITEHRLMMTPTQSQNISWIFLAGMPGAILLFGGLVWLRRRR